MVAYNKFNVTVQDLVDGAHRLASDTIKAMLTDTAPVATNTVKANIIDITAGNGYSAGGPACALTLSNASGVEKVVAAAFTITATGAVGPFRYVVFYNDTQTTPAKPLICWFDLGTEVTLANGQTFTFTPDQTNGLFTVT